MQVLILDVTTAIGDSSRAPITVCPIKCLGSAGVVTQQVLVSVASYVNPLERGGT